MTMKRAPANFASWSVYISPGLETVNCGPCAIIKASSLRHLPHRLQSLLGVRYLVTICLFSWYDDTCCNRMASVDPKHRQDWAALCCGAQAGGAALPEVLARSRQAIMSKLLEEAVAVVLDYPSFLAVSSSKLVPVSFHSLAPQPSQTSSHQCPMPYFSKFNSVCVAQSPCNIRSRCRPTSRTGTLGPMQMTPLSWPCSEQASAQ